VYSISTKMPAFAGFAHLLGFYPRVIIYKSMEKIEGEVYTMYTYWLHPLLVFGSILAILFAIINFSSLKDHHRAAHANQRTRSET
jgi:hypothetical protein